MKVYRTNLSFIPRDIDGIYFLVDITRKDYYDRKEITSLNHTMYLLCTLMREAGVFRDDVLIEQFKALFLIHNKEQEIQIEQDVQNCIATLCEIGFIEVTNHA